jgi:hypothetical protein
MSMSSSQIVLKPLRSAAAELRDAAIAAQSEFVGGTRNAKEHLQAGLTHALDDVAKSNARLQAVAEDVAASTRASLQSVLKRGQDLGRSANRRFFGLRKQAIAQANDALDNTMHYSRDTGRKMQKAASQVSSWAARNPRLVFAVAITACYVAVVRYRRRRKALAAASKKPAARQAKAAVTRTRATATRRPRANGASATK